MNYNFYSLNPKDFEQMIQSLMQKELGISSLIFGEGKDGARELTYEGKATLKNITLDGYWVIQAKFKSKSDKDDDFNWIKKNYDAEIKKFRDKKRNLKTPQNYIFITNANLTAVKDSGGIDKMQKYIEKDKNLIGNIIITSYDSLCCMLDNNRDVSIAYSSFILPGDILDSLSALLLKSEKEKDYAIIRFLQREFKDEINAKLVQAGDSNNQIEVEKVFIDLLARSMQENEEQLFVSDLIEKGNYNYRGNILKKVIIGEAGAGKSTLTQYIVQLYIAAFLENTKQSIKETSLFLKKNEEEKIGVPKCKRLPFKIVLKDYAEWIGNQLNTDSVSIISYLSQLIRKFSSCENFASNHLIELLSKLSFIFIFDGLDEVPSTSNRNKVMDEINCFIDQDLKDSCDAIVIATTRPQGYTNEFGIGKFEHLVLRELNKEQCITYINKLLSSIENSHKQQEAILRKLTQALEDDVTIKLMKTPLQTTIMTLLVRGGGEPAHNKFQLFKDYYDTIVRREKQKGIPFIREYERQIREIHYKLAFYLQKVSESDKNPSAYIDFDEFQIFVINYFIDEGYEKTEALQLSKFLCKSVTERLVFISEVQANKVGFIIRSMQEFFAANHLQIKTDDEIIDSIEKMVYNIYWRNTLLFLIGGIHISGKKSLLERFISLCHTLNGEDLKPSEKPFQANAILKIGSWLALDVLIDEIFIDSKKYTNLLSNILKPLMEISYVQDHLKLCRLSSAILEEWIIRPHISFIEDNSTVLYTLLPLLRNSNYKIIENSIYKACDNKTSIILPLFKKLYSEYSHLEITQNVFIKALERCSIESLIETSFYLQDAFYYNFLDCLTNERFYKKININLVLNKKMTEFLLLYLIRISNGNKNRTVLEFIFRLNNIKLETNIVFKIFEVHEERLNEWFRARFGYLELIDDTHDIMYSIYLNLINICNKNELNYISDYFKFTQTPSCENLDNLINILLHKGSFYYNLFLKKTFVWSFNYTFSKTKIEDVTNLKQKILSSNFCLSPKEISNTYNYLEYVEGWSFSHMNEYNNFIEIYKNTSINNSQEIVLYYLLEVFGIVKLHDFKNNVINVSKQELDLLKAGSGSSIIEKEESKCFYQKYAIIQLLNLVELIDLQSFIENINSHYLMNIDDFSKIINQKGFIDIKEETLKELIKCYRLEIMSKKITNIIYLLPFLVNKESIQNECLLYFPDIYDYIQTLETNNQRELELIIISYLIFSFKGVDENYLINKLYALYDIDPTSLKRIIMYLTILDIRRIWLVNFIILIINLLESKNGTDQELEYTCQSFLKRIVENQTSDLSIM